MKYWLIPVVGLLLIMSCHKYKNAADDAGKNGMIRGRLFLYDTLTGNFTDTLPVKNRAVSIRYATDTVANEFLYSTQTDTAGYFTFSNLQPGKAYKLHYEEVINGIVYTADDSLQEGTLNEVLFSGISTTRNNGIYYVFRDSQQGRVPGVNVCVFTSPVLAMMDTCAGSSFQLPASDAYGRSYKFNLKSDTYNNFIYVTYPGLMSKKHDAVSVPVSGFKVTPIQLP